MELSPALQDAIRGLYITFAKYPLNKFTDPCLHCHTIDEEAKLHSKPLGELEVDDLRDYAVDALLVWGGASEFKHFLPRIFELFFQTDSPAYVFIDPEITFSKFRHALWRTWPKEEQIAVETLLLAMWREILNDPPPQDSFTDIESWVCSIAQCEDDLSPYLQAWLDEDGLPACLTLTQTLISGVFSPERRSGRNAFWDGREEQYVQIPKWLQSPGVFQKLQLAEQRCNDKDLKSEFIAALSVLDLGTVS